MTKNDIQPMPEYFDRYIDLSDDVTYLETLAISLSELENFPIEKWKALGDKVYAPGKWTAKDILQHMIDTERIFGYRMLAISRNEPKTLLPYDEDFYAKNADANHRTIEDLFEELIISRQAFIALYKSFTPEMLLRKGKSFKGEYSVLSGAFMIAGHQRWHFRVVEERYFSLLM